ncbi:MAG TPA: phosphoesterase [Clostridiales bacterium]|nr:phosphoesterase [Clostridiales bacterium]
MSKTFFIADMHFGDANIILYENRPYANIHEMRELMLSNWNTTVSSDDEVFVVGDFINFKGTKNPEEILSRLNGKINLIVGNHDKGYEEFYRNNGVNVIEYSIIYETFWIISHKPMYMNDNMPYVNIFAHVHNNPMYKNVSSRSFCVSAERINYTPIDFEVIKRLVQEEN